MLWNIQLKKCLPIQTVYLNECILFNFFNVYFYFWDRERQSMSWGGADREGDTESKAGSRLWAVSTEPNAGIKPMNCEIMTWAKVRSLADWATQVLQKGSFKWEYKQNCRMRAKPNYQAPGRVELAETGSSYSDNFLSLSLSLSLCLNPMIYWLCCVSTALCIIGTWMSVGSHLHSF